MPTAFTPVSALLGGALIGASATLLLWSLGRVAGVSGIVNAAIEQRDGRGWRLAFVAGLVAGAGAWFALSDAVPRGGVSLPWLLAAGVLVGFGTRIGGGCTSGHGICGLARLSPRSMVAVGAFMGAGFATVYLLRHVAGIAP